MPHFSESSKEKLSTVSPKLQRICNILIKYHDFTVYSGTRTLEEQRILVAQGHSRLLKSKHLVGMAVDLVPYPYSENIEDYQEIAKLFLIIADASGTQVAGGGDGKTFPDYAHFELV